MEQISYIAENYQQLKSNHQKKFWLTKSEQQIIDSITKSSVFYLGCMLWGGFIHSRFKDSPKEITGNNTAKMTEKEIEELDCAVEAKYILKYIESFDRDCKYFLKRPAKISPMLKEILNSYIEFAQLNSNFVGINNTAEVKLPTALAHFDSLSKEQLDALCEKIYSTIESGKIENFLEVGFYNI